MSLLASDGAITNTFGVVPAFSGSVTNTVASLTVTAPPVITAQPESLSVSAGTNISFSAAASGTPPLSYRWRFRDRSLSDGGQFSGAAGTTLYISNVEETNGGDYTVVITNGAGAAVSAVATLTVSVPEVCLSSATGLVGWWPGDGSANDIAGTHNGALQGGVSADASGVVGSALRFDGTSGYVQIPDSPALRPTNLTIEAWVKFTDLDSALSGNASAGEQYIIFKQNSRTYYFEGYSLEKIRVANGDAFMFTVGSASAQEAILFSRTLVSTSVWYHLAGVRGPEFVELYVNGQLEARTNATFAQDYGNYPLYLGTSAQTYWDGKLRGLLDEVSLYNRALSSNEIAAIYAAGSLGKCKAPRITAQPESREVPARTSALFTVTATGAGALSYQWLFNGTSIPGATGTSLALNDVQPTSAGNYRVVVTNALGSATSALAVLRVVDVPLRLIPWETTNPMFGFTLSGAAGEVYVVEVTSNLLQWSPLTLLTNTSGQTDFIDAASATTAVRYYRARLAY